MLSYGHALLDQNPEPQTPGLFLGVVVKIGLSTSAVLSLNLSPVPGLQNYRATEHVRCSCGYTNIYTQLGILTLLSIWVA